MRIVGGTHRGRHITPPAGFNARPTTDFAKENLFNILNNQLDWETTEALDLFAGTGSISFELASRGCLKVDLVELNAKHHAFICKTADAMGFKQLHTVKHNAFSFLKFCTATYDLIFADPPYDVQGIEQIIESVFSRSLLKEDGLLVLEHSQNHSFTAHPHFSQQRTYGSVNFSFFK